MIKMIIPAAGFAAAMLMGAIPGHSAGTIGCGQTLNCRAGVTNTAPAAHIETINFAAGALPRQIVDDATVRSNKARR